MVEVARDPDEIALLRALLDEAEGDGRHLTLVELVVVASAAAGQRVEWFAAHAIVADLWVRGLLSRTVVQRTGQPKQQAYALGRRGRARVGRLLNPRRGDQREDVRGCFQEGSA
jgi:hypothetical protein